MAEDMKSSRDQMEDIFAKAQTVFDVAVASYKKSVEDATAQYQGVLESARKTMEGLVMEAERGEAKPGPQGEASPDLQPDPKQDAKKEEDAQPLMIVLEGERAERLIGALDNAVTGLKKLAKILQLT